MVMRGICLCLLLGPFLMAGVASECVPVQCLMCNVTGTTLAASTPGSCPVCSNSSACINDVLPNCRKDFQLSVNSTGSTFDEGQRISLTCNHNLPNLNLVFGWKKNGKELVKHKNESELVLERALSHDSGQYFCFVNSPCGYFESSPHGVTVNNHTVIILVVCGVSALALVVIMGVAMKFKLKRDNAKHKERMKQRAEAGRSGGPAPFTPRES